VIQGGRVAESIEVFIPDRDMVEMTFEEFNVIRSMVVALDGVTFWQTMDPSGHVLRRDFPVPTITTLGES
jgi:hypothetical protein